MRSTVNNGLMVTCGHRACLVVEESGDGALAKQFDAGSGVEPGLLHLQDRLGDRHDVRIEEAVGDQLHLETRAVWPDVVNGGAEGIQIRTCLLHRRRRATNHHRHGPGPGVHRRSAHRAVEEPMTGSGCLVGDPLREAHIDGGQVQAEGTRFEGPEQVVGIDSLHLGVARERTHHHRDSKVRYRTHELHTALSSCISSSRRRVEPQNMMARRHQMCGHGPAHPTQTDEPDHCQLLSSASHTQVVAERSPGWTGDMPTRGRWASTSMVSISGPGPPRITETRSARVIASSTS